MSSIALLVFLWSLLWSVNERTRPRRPARWRHMQHRAGIENLETGERLSYPEAMERGLVPLEND